jgi:hypothetical protein
MELGIQAQVGDMAGRIERKSVVTETRLLKLKGQLQKIT